MLPHTGLCLRPPIMPIVSYDIDNPSLTLWCFFADLGYDNIVKISKILDGFEPRFELRGYYLDGYELKDIPQLLETMGDFIEYIFLNYKKKFLGGKIVFIGGSCNLLYVIAKILAGAYGIENKDIVLIYMPEYMCSRESIINENNIYNYLRDRGAIDDGRPIVFIDNGWKGKVPWWLKNIVRKKYPEMTIEGFLMSSAGKTDSLAPSWEIEVKMENTPHYIHTRAYQASSFLEGNTRFVPRRHSSMKFSYREHGTPYIDYPLNDELNIKNAWCLLRKTIIAAEDRRDSIIAKKTYKNNLSGIRNNSCRQKINNNL